MKHLDLFTGIGGFSYAAQCVWGKDYEPVAFCEIDKFCQKIIRKHWPKVEIIDDIRDREKFRKFKGIDIITAGVPCQAASVAGAQRGAADPRWLWPETLNIIGLVRPRYAILENVPGLFTLEEGLAFNGILSRLAEIGYDCWWEVIPACAVGACHRRDRIWIVAYCNDSGRRLLFQQKQIAKRKIKANIRCNDEIQSFADAGSKESNGLSGIKRQTMAEIRKNSGDATDAEGTKQLRFGNTRTRRNRFADDNCAVADPSTGNAQQGNDTAQWRSQCLVEGRKANSSGIDSRCGDGRRIKTTGDNKNRNDAWNQNWLEVATRLCGVANGIPDRIHRLKALGNAIVPQVAMALMQAIKEVEENSG